jgi:outer membrane protein
MVTLIIVNIEMNFLNKSYFVYVLLLFLSFTAHAQDQSISHVSLQTIWAKALSQNKSIQIQALKVTGSEEAIKDAKAERLPDLEAEGEYARVSNMPVYTNGLFHAHDQFEVVHTAYDFGGNAYLNLYNGNKTSLKIREEKQRKELAIQQKNLTSSEIKLQATAYYLDLQRNRIFKNLLLKDISDQERQLAEIRQLLKNGVVLKSDVLRAELNLSRQRMSMIQLDNDLAITNQRLNILIGNDDNVQNIPDSTSEVNSAVRSYEDYLMEASANSFESKISEQEVAISKLEIRNVKANTSFKVGFFAKYAYSYPQIRFYPYSIALYGLGLSGIKASFPISSFYHNKHKVQAAQIAYQQQEISHAQISDDVRQEVKEAYLRYTEALKRIEVAKENIRQATENLRIVNNTYFNQLSLLTDLLDADTQLLQTRFDLAAAQIASQLQYYKLQKVTGNL